MPTTTSSFMMVTRRGKSAPSSGNQLTLYFFFRRSTMAFFITDWMSEGLNSLLLMEVAFATQNLPSSGMNRSQGSALVPSKSSSKVEAWKLPTFNKMRSVVRRKILERQMASLSPANVIFPSSTPCISYPRFRISLFKTASVPKWQGAINSNWPMCFLTFRVCYHDYITKAVKYQCFYLPKFLSASLSSIAVALATAQSSALQSKNLFSVKFIDI